MSFVIASTVWDVLYLPKKKLLPLLAKAELYRSTLFQDSDWQLSKDLKVI